MSRWLHDPAAMRTTDEFRQPVVTVRGTRIRTNIDLGLRFGEAFVYVAAFVIGAGAGVAGALLVAA